MDTVARLREIMNSSLLSYKLSNNAQNILFEDGGVSSAQDPKLTSDPVIIEVCFFRDFYSVMSRLEGIQLKNNRDDTSIELYLI